MPLSLNLLLKNQLRMLNSYFDVVALSSPGDDLDLVGQREGVRTLAVPIKREISIFSDLVSLFRLWILFRKEKPAIVHSNTPKSSLLSMFAGWLANVPARIYTITGLRYETETGIKRRILIAMEQLTCRFASHVVAESNGVKEMITADRLTSKPVVIIGNGNLNGIDSEYWDPAKVDESSVTALKEKYKIHADDFVFVFIGRLVTDKGVNELVKAFDRLNMNRAKLLLIGPLETDLDPLNIDVLERIEKNQNILAVGYQHDIRLHLAISTVLVLPSYREGFPNVLLQAGAMGLPMISTKVNGAQDVVEDGKNGVLIEKKSIADLERAMLEVFGNFAGYDAENSRTRILASFSQEYYYPELLKFYYSLN